MDLKKKKKMISAPQISKCPEFEVKSKIGKIFKKHDPLEEYSVRIYEIDLYFYEHYEKKIQVDKNGRKYIPFIIDVYFNKFLLAVEIDEKGHTDRDLIFEKKRQEALEKKLGFKFIRIKSSNAKSGYDLDYEVCNIEAFIGEFNDRQLEKEKLEKEKLEKKTNKKIKELADKIKEKEEKSNKKIKELEAKIKELEDKKNSTTNQITNNFRKIIIKN